MSRDFHRFWLAVATSGLGDGLRQAALPLLLAALTRDPLTVSLATVAGFLPWVFGPVIGAVVDRRNRRRLIAAAQALRGLAIAALGVAAAVGVVTPGVVYAVSFLLGLGEVMVDTVIQAAVPELAGDLTLEQANGRVQAADQLANRIVGPPLGAALFTVGAALPFVADAATFVVAAGMLLTIRTPLQQERVGPATTVRDDVRAGLEHLRRDVVLRPLLLVLVLANVGNMAWTSVAVLFVVDVLEQPESVFGILLGVSALGGVAGGLGAPSLIGRYGRSRLYVAAPALTALGLALVVARPSIAVVFVGAVLANIGGAAFSVSIAALRQQLTPPALLGRVSSSFRAVALSGVPVGALLGGIVATAYGIVATFALGAVVFAAVALRMVPISRRLSAALVE